MTYTIRFTEEAADDLERLYLFLLESDAEATGRALESINSAVRLLEFSPFSCRKARAANPFLRELIIPFGQAGYVALFEIEPAHRVTIIAVRHQREEDYH
jgi:plasmid stabilization system protein ParE